MGRWVFGTSTGGSIACLFLAAVQLGIFGAESSGNREGEKNQNSKWVD